MKDKSMQAMQETSHLSGNSASYVDDLYEQFLHDSSSIPNEWQQFFNNLKPLTDAESNGKDISHADIRDYFRAHADSFSRTQAAPLSSEMLLQQKKQAHVLTLMSAYRLHGHHHAHLDPLEMRERFLDGLERGDGIVC